MPQEAQLGWFGALDHFSFSCVFGQVAAKRGRTKEGMLGWTWILQCLGTPLAPLASWGRCCGTVPQVPQQLCPH